MAQNFTERIRELEGDRRQHLRMAGRARDRRREHLRSRDWDEARNALQVARRHNREAQVCLHNIRKLRSARSEANRVDRLVRHRRSAGRAYDGGQLYWFDGKPVRAEVYPHLVWARTKGHNGVKWRGRVWSGYRTPAYSQGLCRSMCGWNSCPGTCAGTGSNHVRIAIDVDDWSTFAYLMRFCPYEPRIFNNLPHDRVHFSPNGH